MDRYTIYCTEEQTRKALELGAPITWFRNGYVTKRGVPSFEEPLNDGGWLCYVSPTAEQMIGRLEESEEIDAIVPFKIGNVWVYVVYMAGWRPDIRSHGFTTYPTRKEATLAAIDSALDYLIKNKK